MNLITIPEIHITPDRIRKEFDDLVIEDMACSIYREGLHHAILLSVKNNVFTLVAGETRLRAMKLLKDCGLTFYHNQIEIDSDKVPYTLLRETDDAVLAFEAELNENLKRKDLTWQEQVVATNKLHELRVAEYGESGRGVNDSRWNIKKTAEEIASRKTGRKANNADITRTQEALLIAQHMDDPFVAAAKDQNHALKVIRENIKHDKRKQLKEEFDATNGVDLLELPPQKAEDKSYYSSQYTLIHGDFFIEAPNLPSNHFDVILTDPPYGIDIHKMTQRDGGKHDYNDSEEYFDSFISTLASEAFRVAKDTAHAYVFCNIRRFDRLFVAFELAGWRVWRRPIIWDKGNTGSFGDATHGPRQTYDAILYAIKGEKETTALYRDVIPIAQPTIGDHPASKPAALFSDLLKRSVYPGDRVVDFFCGSGPIFEASKELDLYATGIEMNDKYYLMSVERISKL